MEVYRTLYGSLYSFIDTVNKTHHYLCNTSTYLLLVFVCFFLLTVENKLK